MATLPTLAVFRSRAVVIAGIADVVLGVCLVGAGAVVASRNAGRGALSLAVILVALGAMGLMSGIGRAACRLEIQADRVRWRWSYGWHEVALRDLEGAALVEKGSPASGAAWSGFLGGSFTGVLLWWLAELAYSVFSNEPMLGPLDLVLMQQHGEPIEVKAISSWSSRVSQSEANQALDALRTVIHTSAPPTVQSRQLLHDAWETPGSEGYSGPMATQLIGWETPGQRP